MLSFPRLVFTQATTIRHRRLPYAPRYLSATCLEISPLLTSVLSQHPRAPPIVALESTVISHGGMPYPDNLSTALSLEDEVRQQGAIPATIAILNGKLRVGLTLEQLEALAKQPVNEVMKCSTRDLPIAVATGKMGSCTVAATMWAAHLAGIQFFATGGLGGVHRGAFSGEVPSLDVSADLLELQRTPVTVVCAGVKSILDVAGTLEWMETQSIPVGVVGDSIHFPLFFSRGTHEHVAQFHCSTPQEAADVVYTMRDLGISSGMVLAVPPPPEGTLVGMEAIIQDAIKTANARNLKGKNVTPFLLAQVAKLTGGESISNNIALLRNNARMAGKIAFAYSQKRGMSTYRRRRVIVIGGVAMDLEARAFMPTRKSTTVPGIVEQRPGGVGRNIAHAFGLLAKQTREQLNTLFICAVGDDENGNHMLKSMQNDDCTVRAITKKGKTPCVVQILGSRGEFVCGVADFDNAVHMDVKDVMNVLPGELQEYDATAAVVLDGNLGWEVTKTICDLCLNAKIPIVCFEPTSAPKAASVGVKVIHHPALTMITPNLEELVELTNGLLDDDDELKWESRFHDIHAAVRNALAGIDIVPDMVAKRITVLVRAMVLSTGSSVRDKKCKVLLSMGSQGALALEVDANTWELAVDTMAFPVDETIVSVSGAGDVQSAVFVWMKVLLNDGFILTQALSVARQGAFMSMKTRDAVPARLGDVVFKLLGQG